MPYKLDGLTVYSRGDWGVGPSRASVDSTRKHTYVVHHSAFNGERIDTLAEQKATMRSMYDFHTGPQRGWDDIGYSFVIFQPTRPGAAGRIFEGRGLKRLPAAQGGANTGTVAVCVVQMSEGIKDGTVTRLKSLYVRTTCANVKGHRDFGGTDCPGDGLYKVLSRIRAAK